MFFVLVAIFAILFIEVKQYNQLKEIIELLKHIRGDMTRLVNTIPKEDIENADN